jgi:hypothetical protein
MGANATTFVPSYTAGEVLTAANLSVTNSGIPVFATTVTRDAAFGGTGEKTLAQGQMAFIEATNTTQFYNGTAWVSSLGLQLVTAQTIGTGVSSLTVSNCFSSSYDNYRVIVNNMAASSLGASLYMTINGSAGSTYEGNLLYWSTANTTITNSNYTATSSFQIGILNTTRNQIVFDITNPNLASQTIVSGSSSGYSSGGSDYGCIFTTYDSNSASSVSLTITPAAGTFTGGTISVYGYSKA